MRLALFVLVTVFCTAPALADERAPCRGERVAVVPLEPVGLPPPQAREEEERVRAALEGVPGVCLVPRRDSVEKLRARPGHRLPACEDAECRRKEASAFGADWLYSGTVYGLGGGRTVSLQLWNSQGTVVQGGSFSSADADAGERVRSMLRDARLGSSLVASRAPAQTRSRWPELATGALAVTSVAVGLGFGAAARNTEQMISERAVPCTGTGDAYAQCFAATERDGQRKATLANAFLGAGAALATGAVVMFVMEWP